MTVTLTLSTGYVIKEPFGDLFIAEVSSKSTGLGIELGWANLMNVPIACFHKKGIKSSSSLRVITKEIIEYEKVYLL